jgi:hypothetical protein
MGSVEALVVLSSVPESDLWITVAGCGGRTSGAPIGACFRCTVAACGALCVVFIVGSVAGCRCNALAVTVAGCGGSAFAAPKGATRRCTAAACGARSTVTVAG